MGSKNETKVRGEFAPDSSCRALGAKMASRVLQELSKTPLRTIFD